MNDKVKRFKLDPKTIKVKELLNSDFLELEIKAISTAYPNRNQSHFTKEALEKAIPTFYNKPILGAFSVDLDDFRAHEGDLTYDKELENLYYDYTSPLSETPLGLIRGDDTVAVIHSEKDGLDWITFTCAIWVKYNYKQVKKLLKSKDGHKKISVEIEVNDSYVDEDNIEVINDFTFDGVTILGDDFETGIADAEMTILDVVENALFAKKTKALAFAYNSLKNVNNSDDDINSDQKNNTFETNPVVNEEVPEVTMDQDNEKEGGISKVNLTMQAKIELLSNALRESLNGYAWVMDFDDEYVYFESDEGNFRCKYEITEDTEGKHVVLLSVNEKEPVIRSWTVVFAEDKKEQEACDSKEEEACGSKEDEACGDSKEEEACDSKEEEACGDKQEEACGDKEEEACGDKEAEACDDCDDSEEDKEDECKFAAVEADLNSEPESIDTEGKEMTQIIEESTAGIAAPEAQDSADAVGDANGEVASMLGGSVEEAIVSEQEPEPAEGSPEPEADVEQPDDEAKGELFSEQNDVSSESDEHEKIEFNGEMIDIHQLLEKYNELNNNFTELQNSVKAEAALKLAKIGENFVNDDKVVDEESKANYIKSITEKCISYEFTTEEEVLKFAKGLLAMYYYENRTQKESSEEFSVSIEQPAHVGKDASGSKLKDAIYKLNHLQSESL